MKKVVLGTGLLICAVILLAVSQLREAIFFASPNSISTGTDPLMLYAGIFFLAGVVFNVLGFIERKK